MCTVFGLEDEEVQGLIRAGFKMTDHNKEDEGYEVKNSAFKVRTFLKTESVIFPLERSLVFAVDPIEVAPHRVVSSVRCI